MLVENSTSQLLAFNFESPFQQVLQEQGIFLRKYNKMNKWQLWLSDRPMLKRSWIDFAGLDTQKVIQIANLHQNNLIQAIEKAVASKTCSYIVACINQLNPTNQSHLFHMLSTSETPLILIYD